MKLFCRLFISFVLLVSFQLSNNCYAQNNSIVLDGAYIVMDGGTAANSIYIVVDQPNPLGIVRLPSGGHINSENQFNIVKWLTDSSTGSYVFPFGVGGNAADYIPFTFNKTVGNNSVSVSTWATNIPNDPKPLASNVGAVTNMIGTTDSVIYAIDRFWDIQAKTTTADLTFSYKGSENTTSSPTNLVQAQHWNGNSWDIPVGPGTAGVTTGIGTAGPFIAQNTFSPWVLITACPTDTSIQNPIICQGSSITVGVNTYTTTGTFIDTLTSIQGCDSVVITNLTVSPKPTLTLIKEDDSCNSDIGSATAIATSNNSPINYLWNTGATDSTINNLSKGTYSVTVTDSIGCTTSKSITLIDSCHNALEIPNVITPNGDGKNDVFKILGISLYPGTMVLIFDRWGREVYKNDDYKNDWDGGDLADGSYLYIITANDREQTVYKGNLTILSSGE